MTPSRSRNIALRGIRKAINNQRKHSTRNQPGGIFLASSTQGEYQHRAIAKARERPHRLFTSVVPAKSLDSQGETRALNVGSYSGRNCQIIGSRGCSIRVRL